MREEIIFKIKNNKILLKDISISVTNIFLVLLLLNVISQNIGIYDFSFMFLLSAYILIALLLFNLPITFIEKMFSLKFKNINFIFFVIGLFLIFLCFVIIIFLKSVNFFLISIPIFLIGLNIFLQSFEIKRKELFLLTVVSLLYFLFYYLNELIPPLRFAIQNSSLSTSYYLGALAGEPLLFGPTVSGFHIILSFIIFYIGLFIISKTTVKTKIKYLLLEIILMIISWIIFFIILSNIGFQSKSNAMDYHYLIFVISIIPTIIFFSLSRNFIDFKCFAIPRINLRIITSNLKKLKTWLIFFIFIISILSFSVIATNEKNYNDEEIDVLFITINNLGSFNVPAYGIYGEHSAGMFGLLPYYLNLTGYDCHIVVENKSQFIYNSYPNYANTSTSIQPESYLNIIESEKLTSDILDNMDILVIINLGTSFSPNMHSIIWDFVDKGGSLLVLGDHTDVGGIQKPLNNLLEPTGIRYRFDSGIPMDPNFNWESCYELTLHPILNDLKSKNEIQFSVGATLDIAPTTNPILIGKYGFSDIGDRDNTDRAFLGDYAYNKGEQIGDVILAASTYYGKGKVVVFADTSSFQNPSLPSSYPLVKGVFNWLKSNRTVNEDYIQIISILILTILIIISLWIFNSDKKRFLTYFIVIILLFSMIISYQIINPSLRTKDEIKGNIAYIDVSHQERLNQDAYEDNSMNALIINLMRNDYLPLFLKEFNNEYISNSEILVLNAPTNSFSENEIELISNYIYKGGLVILATGYYDKKPSEELLNKFNLDILKIPLGPVPYVEEAPELYQDKPRFSDAFPIELKNYENTEIFYNENISGKSYTLMTFTSYGEGGLLLISDTQFLYNKNIETLYTLWPGNIKFLRNIISEFKTGGVLE